jgi:hypothetical protein
MLDKTAKILITALIITNILTIIALTRNPFTTPSNASNNPTTPTTSISTTSIPTIPLKQIRIANAQLIIYPDNIYLTITVQNTGSIPAKSVKVLLPFLHNLTIPQTPQSLQPGQTYTLVITGKIPFFTNISYPVTTVATFSDNTQETDTTYITPTTAQNCFIVILPEQQSIQVCSTLGNTMFKGGFLLIESVDAPAGTNVATVRVKNIGQAPIQITGITLNNGLSVTSINPSTPFWIGPGAETPITITINSNFQEGPTYVITINYNIANGPPGAVSYTFWSTPG